MHSRADKGLIGCAVWRLCPILVFFLGMEGRTGPDERYFPPQVLHAWRPGLEMCLREAGEKPLWPGGTDRSRHAYRLVWLPSFSPPVIVRLDVVEGAGILCAREAEGTETGPDAPIHPLPSVRVGSDNVAVFLGKVSEAGFWDSAKRTGVGGTDGEVWMLEAVSDGYYQVVAWQNPDLEILREDSTPGRREQARAYMNACNLLQGWAGVESVDRCRRETAERLAKAIRVVQRVTEDDPDGEAAGRRRRVVRQMTRERELVLEFLERR